MFPVFALYNSLLPSEPGQREVDGGVREAGQRPAGVDQENSALAGVQAERQLLGRRPEEAGGIQ